MKKILFVSHGFACFMSDILFHGFKKLGYDIYEYPQGTHYYGGESVFAGRKNLGKGSFLDFCYFDFPKSHLSDEEILNQDYDAVIITSWRPEQPFILENIYKRFKGKVPIAFVDGEDDLNIRTNEFYSDIYFKRELPLKEVTKVKPITFGIIDEEKYRKNFSTEKKFSVSFIASGHNPAGMRCQMFKRLMALRAEYDKSIYYHDCEHSTRGMLSYLDYVRFISGSHAGISIRGEGYDTYRYWEIPYFNTLLMADIPTIYIENNFTDMKNAVFFKDVDEWEQKFEFLKDNPQILEQIRKAGNEHLLKYHTSKNRAEYVISEMEKLK